MALEFGGRFEALVADFAPMLVALCEHVRGHVELDFVFGRETFLAFDALKGFLGRLFMMGF